jgi:predicted acylesterase/phospholipase RssA/CRP-like cAMP-binding protein
MTNQIQQPETNILALLSATYCFASLPEESLQILSDHAKIITIKTNDILFKQNDTGNDLYIIITGDLAVSWHDKDGVDIVFDTVKTGDTIGEMQIMVGGKRTVTLTASSECTMLILPRESIDTLSQQHPIILNKMGDLLTRRLRLGQLAMAMPKLFGDYDTTVFREIEKQATWLHLKTNEILYKKDEPANSLCLVISGRLQVFDEKNQSITGEVSRGECVGEVSMLSDKNRTSTVKALRETDLLKFNKEAFEQIINQYPLVMKAISRIIIERYSSESSKSIDHGDTSIAIIPISPGIDLREFCKKLSEKLSRVDKSLHIHSQNLQQLIDMPDAANTKQNDPQSIRLKILLDNIESRNHFTLYQADTTTSEWTKWCIKRADKIILVCDADAPPEISKIEQPLFQTNNSQPSNIELVILQPANRKLPINTHKWLAPRRIRLHHHVRWIDSDFSRLARFLSGRAIGIAMSGGGARGFAHFGICEALREAGIAIDMIGGTSMGGYIGAQCASEMDRASMLDTNRRNLIDSNPYKQYILPFISLLSSKKLKANLKNIFSDTRIEDMWINFFCVSSNLSTSKSVIHRSGLLAEAIRASTAIPGIAEPVIQKGEILIDGGVLNNLPGDIIQQYCGTVIVVDVSSKFDWTNYHSVPSPWQFLLNKILPFTTKEENQFPSIIDVLVSSTLLSSTGKAKTVENNADFYLHPPVEEFKLLEFKALDKLVELGHSYIKTEIENGNNKQKWQKLHSELARFN